MIQSLMLDVVFQDDTLFMIKINQDEDSRLYQDLVVLI